MNVIRTNKPNFFGNNGEPLQSGYIHIGQPNQDPINFPKTVTFEDSQGNQSTAVQPLRTNAQGQIERNGKAIISLVDGDYSMLILDSTQTQIEDGFTPLVEPDTSGGGGSDLTGYREYSLLLADVKKLIKAPGQTVSSIGAASTIDREGVDWLVVSNTGNPADDVDLIDFDNGLQGTRIVNNLSVLKNLEEIADAGGAAQDAAAANLNLYTKAENDTRFMHQTPVFTQVFVGSVVGSTGVNVSAFGTGEYLVRLSTGTGSGRVGYNGMLTESNITAGNGSDEVTRLKCDSSGVIEAEEFGAGASALNITEIWKVT